VKGGDLLDIKFFQRKTENLSYRRKNMRTTSVAISIMIGVILIATAELGYGQVINACIQQGGKLRIVTNVTECKKNETPISWSSGYQTTYWKSEAFSLEGYGLLGKCLSCDPGDIAIGGNCSIAGLVDWSLIGVGFGSGPPPTEWCCTAGNTRGGTEGETLNIRVDCATPLQ
jgi:hypothetical protein